MFYLKGRNDFDKNWLDDFFGAPIFKAPELKANVVENEKNYELDLEMPGFNKNEIKISLDNNYLTVEARKESKEEHKEHKYLCKEIRNDVLTRSFYLDNVNEDSVKATYENGILHILVDKQEKNDKKFITID